MKLKTIKIHTRDGDVETLTVGTVRQLLTASARRRIPRVDPRVTNATARAVIGKALRGRPAGGPVSPLVANLATSLAGLQPARVVR